MFMVTISPFLDGKTMVQPPALLVFLHPFLVFHRAIWTQAMAAMLRARGWQRCPRDGHGGFNGGITSEMLASMDWFTLWLCQNSY